jgi:hypothetical protein
MKKLIMLAVVGVFTLSSFGLKEKKGEVTLYKVYYHCADGSGGGSFLINNMKDAQAVANHLCS